MTDDDRALAVGRCVLALCELLRPRVEPQPERPAATAPAPLLSKQQIAAALGISPAGVDRLVRDGKIPHVRVGDVRRFDLAAVRAALEASAPATTTTTTRDGAPVRLLSRGPR